MRLIGVAAKERWFNLPQVATLAEQGLKDFTFDAWNGLFVPKGISSDAVMKLDAAVNEPLKTQAVRDALLNLGYLPMGGPPAVLADRVAADIKTYRPLIDRKVIQLNE